MLDLFGRQSVGRHRSQDILFGWSLCSLLLGLHLAAPGADDQTTVLTITVGEPTKLSDRVYQNTASLMVSRTGVLAAFYPKPRTGPKFYRVSSDGGHSWSPEMNGPPELGGGADSGTLRDGGVIMPASDLRPTAQQDWFEMLLLRFTDDFRDWSVETARLHLPGAGVRSLDGRVPAMAKGKMLQLSDGSLLAPLYGGIKGDSERLHRSFLARSQDEGRTWNYHGSIAYEPVDPTPDLPGMYLSACEPSIGLLGDGRLLAMLRTQYSHYPAEYKPLAVSWSSDLGKTWTPMEPTRPHLMNISPTLAVLDNGVVACQYGRPGFHIAFSLDNGQTWRDRISFSHLPEPLITGQFDMVKVGPNDLVAVGSDHEGVKVWPLTVERAVVSPDRVPLRGRIADRDGRPIRGAIVERSPNRYAADDWLEDEESKLDLWKAAPKLIGSPQLAYRSIQSANGHPTTLSDAEGRFDFGDVRLGEYVLTAEADGYAPRHRHIKVGPRPVSQEIVLTEGRFIRGQIVDEEGRPVPGACVVLNRWHCHTDSKGYYHWAVEAPVPRQVSVRIYRRYSRRYGVLKASLAMAQLGEHPTTLPSSPSDK